MDRLVLVAVLLVGMLGQGCASSRPSYVKPAFEDVGEVCDKTVEVGKVVLLATLVAAAVAGYVYLDLQDGELNLCSDE